MTPLLSDSRRPRRGAASGGFVLALVGFLLALATAGYIVYRDPPWGRLSKYDFGTPEAALKSQIRMLLNADAQAQAEYSAKVDRKELREKMDTLEIAETAEFDKKKVLFIKFKATDKEKKETKERKEVEWFEKDEDTGYWRPTYVSEFKVREKDKALADKIEKWTNRGGFGGPGD